MNVTNFYICPFFYYYYLIICTLLQYCSKFTVMQIKLIVVVVVGLLFKRDKEKNRKHKVTNFYCLEKTKKDILIFKFTGT